MRGTDGPVALKRAVAGAAAALALAAAAPGSAATPTEITALVADVTARRIAVSGDVAFGGQEPVIVAEDAVETAAVPGIDLIELLVSKPDPGAGEVVFTMRLATLDDGVPELLAYNWDIAVDGGNAAGGSNWSIKSMRQNFYRTNGTAPYAAIHSCTPIPGGSTCPQVATVPVVFDGDTDEIRIAVPLATIRAKPGSTIAGWERNGSPAWVRLSATGVATTTAEFDALTPSDYVVPVPEVAIGVARTGTALEAVAFTPIQLRSDGSFGHGHTVGKSGTYDVWAKACYGANCTTSRVTARVL